ncbi:Alpha/beta hydrolase family-domain-containing protein [Pisolithus tinctorius]|nr:Alpha/beta hydrolase family-domain-containing protein [Pisolithus tinctorius]KAI6143572.1 Alpha/beta hydrolase family-domain-containing protein [Pisolithus tinctorius]
MSTKTSSVPHKPPPPWVSISSRSVLPTPLRIPSLPSPPRQDTIHAAYTLSTHIIPAVSPRLVPDVPVPKVPTHNNSMPASERRKQATTIIRELIERQMCFAQGKLTGDRSQKPLWNCVNRYVRVHRHDTLGTGLTLFLVPATGLPKEIWETMLRSLLDSTSGLVDEVWSWEAVNHGDSALVNAESLSGIFDWHDDARDIANFLLNYLPEKATPVSLPTCLARVPEATSDARKELGYHCRRLVVVGHSFGGTSLTLAALNFPKLFSSLILVDPIILADKTRTVEEAVRFAVNAFTRRMLWSSREDALRQFKQSPFFASWHPEVLKTYVDHGLTVDATGGVRLKMTTVQEGLSYISMHISFEVWKLLEKLDKNITLRWIVPSPGFLGEEDTKVRVWRRPTNASNVVFPSVGHLIVQEAPIELAQDIATFLSRNYGSPQIKAVL